MSFIQKQKRKFGDRPDGHRIKNISGIFLSMIYILPKRCDTEVSMNKELDITKMLKYIEEKNAKGPEYQTKFFHCFVAMVVRILNERRELNRFIQGRRMYERDEITVSFVAKKEFADGAKETILEYKGAPDHNVDNISEFILKKVDKVRKDSSKHSVTDSMDFLKNTPRLIGMLIARTLIILDFFGCTSKAFRKNNPFYSSVLISNLGSIGCGSVYHHLNNIGTNSIMFTIGTIRKKNVLKEDGTVDIRDVVDITAIADERICDGFYFAKSLKLLDFYCENPQYLDKKFEEEIEIK